jgi:hypothetical protein
VDEATGSVRQQTQGGEGRRQQSVHVIFFGFEKFEKKQKNSFGSKVQEKSAGSSYQYYMIYVCSRCPAAGSGRLF